MADRLVLLGTGTCQLQAHRLGSSILLELGALRVVFDFGRGIAGRLASMGLVQDDIRHVVLSHFHPDHISDLVPFLHAGAWSQIDPRSADLHLYGPRGLGEIVGGLVDLFGADSLTAERYRLHLHEVTEEPFTIEARDFFFADLPPAGNHGLRFRHGGKTCALTGDSEYHDQEVEFLQGVDLAVIDAGHISDDEIVELAVRTEVEHLVCSHLYRELDEAALNARAGREGYAGRILVGEDLMAFQL